MSAHAIVFELCVVLLMPWN